MLKLLCANLAAKVCRFGVEQRHCIGSMQAVAIQRAADMIRGSHEQLPEHFRFPGCESFWVHSVNIRVGQQAQPLQSLWRHDSGRKRRNGCGIKNIAPLHRRGHIQVVFDQEVHFGFFFRGKFQSVRGRLQRLQAARHMIFHRHTLADIVQKQRKNQQIAAVHRSPQRAEVRAHRIGSLGQFLKMLDRSQGMLVHCISMIEIADH